VFRQLTKPEVKEIADIMLREVFKRAADKEIKIDVTERFKVRAPCYHVYMSLSSHVQHKSAGLRVSAGAVQSSTFSRTDTWFTHPMGPPCPIETRGPQCRGLSTVDVYQALIHSCLSPAGPPGGRGLQPGVWRAAAAPRDHAPAGGLLGRGQNCMANNTCVALACTPPCALPWLPPFVFSDSPLGALACSLLCTSLCELGTQSRVLCSFSFADIFAHVWVQRMLSGEIKVRRPKLLDRLARLCHTHCHARIKNRICLPSIIILTGFLKPCRRGTASSSMLTPMGRLR